MAKRPSNAKNKASEDAAERFRPSPDAILRFLSDNPDQAGKREIAKAFNLKGEDRVWLRDTLRDMQEQGLLEKRRKRLGAAGEPPPVAVLRISGRDKEGGLLARFDEPSEGFAGVSVSVSLPRRGSNGPTPGVGDRVLAKIFRGEDGARAYSARVMKLLERRDEAVLGIVRRLEDGSFRLEPAQRRQPEILLDARALDGAVAGDLVEVEPERASRYGLPRGRVTAVVGPAAGEKAVSTIALHAHGIPHIFPPSVIAESEAAKPAVLGKREDWREMPVVTIDPADAKDHDDAVWAEPDSDENNPGGHIAYVAIADVAAYVLPGSAMDTEALKRGNSVYFPDRVVPMLPERISNDLCSLKENVDRPALAVRMVFEATGKKRSHTFHRVMMRSHARLAYAQAQNAIDGAPDAVSGEVLEQSLKPVWAAYAVLKRGRDARQPLDLDLPERKILLNADGGVDRVIVPERLDAHRLIEEFMIQANVAAAETLEARRQPLIYRVHDTPSLAKQESLREYLQTVGISLARGPALRPAQFNTILASVKGKEHETLTNEVVLRSQSQAAYNPANIGHFGLNLHRYAHFTSPIRRYADLVVHRALIAALGLGPGGLTREEEAHLEQTASQISDAERRAMAAERETVDRLIAGFLAGRLNEVFAGRISGVTKAGLFVQLPQYGADGFVPVSTLGTDYFVFDETRRALIGQRSGLGFQLADPITVKLVEVAPLAGAMRFEVESEPKPLGGGGRDRSFHKVKRQQTRGRAVVGKAAHAKRGRG